MIDELRGARLFARSDAAQWEDRTQTIVAWESGGPPGCVVPSTKNRYGSYRPQLQDLDTAGRGQAIPSRWLVLVWLELSDGLDTETLRFLDLQRKPTLASLRKHLLRPSEARAIAVSARKWGATRPHGRVWCFKGRFFSSREDLTASDAQALVDASDLSKKRVVQRAEDKVALHRSAASKPGRDAIPDDVKVFVWRRDGGSCVRCGAQTDLEFDHVIPVTMGGGNTERNLQILCGSCNRSKGGNLV